jgi:hypothetical protein
VETVYEMVERKGFVRGVTNQESQRMMASTATGRPTQAEPKAVRNGKKAFEIQCKLLIIIAMTGYMFVPFLTW